MPTQPTDKPARKSRAKKPAPPPSFRLLNWSVVNGSSNPFKDPRLAGIRLSGNVYGHPSFADGHAVTTSRVLGVEGRRCTVESGRVYVLEGDPEAPYLEWLKENGKAYNSEQPIALVVAKVSP